MSENENTSGLVASTGMSAVRTEPQIIGVEAQAHEGHVSDFMKNLPKYLHDLFWLTVFFLPIAYFSSLTIGALTDALSSLQENWLVAHMDASFIFWGFVILLVLLSGFAISIVLVVGIRIVREFVLMRYKKDKYEAEEEFKLGLKYYRGDGDESK